jgi:hypothetical protein
MDMVSGMGARGQVQEFFQGYRIFNLAFHLRVCVDMKPFLQEQAFEQQQWGIGVGAFATGADDLVVYQNSLNPWPNSRFFFKINFKWVLC